MWFKIVLADPKGKPDKDERLMQELVDGGQYKQALTVCEKRLKKRPGTALLVRDLSFTKTILSNIIPGQSSSSAPLLPG
jgi:hypothetical protein